MFGQVQSHLLLPPWGRGEGGVEGRKKARGRGGEDPSERAHSLERRAPVRESSLEQAPAAGGAKNTPSGVEPGASVVALCEHQRCVLVRAIASPGVGAQHPSACVHRAVARSTCVDVAFHSCSPRPAAHQILVQNSAQEQERRRRSPNRAATSSAISALFLGIVAAIAACWLARGAGAAGRARELEASARDKVALASGAAAAVCCVQRALRECCCCWCSESPKCGAGQAFRAPFIDLQKKRVPARPQRRHQSERDRFHLRSFSSLVTSSLNSLICAQAAAHHKAHTTPCEEGRTHTWRPIVQQPNCRMHGHAHGSSRAWGTQVPTCSRAVVASTVTQAPPHPRPQRAPSCWC